MKRLISITLAAFLVIGLSSTSFAQTSANDNINANATVLTGISVTGNSDLTFGDISPGVDKTIAPDAADAGQFTVAGGSGASVDLVFTSLPGDLTDTNSNTLAINYTAYAGDTYDSNNTFTPTQGSSITTANSIPSDGDLNVWLGGTVQPTNNQAAGTYDAQITLTATYN